MLSAKNNVILEGNLVAEPEQVSDGIVTMRLAVNNGGYEANELTAGFFNIKIFFSGLVESHANFIKRQIDNGGFTKGSRIVVMGQLRQERWKSSEDQNRDKIIVIANSVEYAGFKSEGEGGSEGAPAAKTSGAASSSSDVPDAF